MPGGSRTMATMMICVGVNVLLLLSMLGDFGTRSMCEAFGSFPSSRSKGKCITKSCHQHKNTIGRSTAPPRFFQNNKLSFLPHQKHTNCPHCCEPKRSLHSALQESSILEQESSVETLSTPIENGESSLSSRSWSTSPGSSVGLVGSSYPEPSNPDLDSFRNFSLSEREQYLRNFGRHHLSVCLMESPPFEYFDVPGKGFVAYQSRPKPGTVFDAMQSWLQEIRSKILGGSPHVSSAASPSPRYVFALGDPVCDDRDVPELIDLFLKRNPGAIFVQVARPVTAEALSKFHGYSVTPMGCTVVVDLPSWNLKGKKKQSLRTAVNAARKRGIVVREVNRNDETEARSGRDVFLTAEDRTAVAQKWLATRTATDEIGFLIRPPDASYQTGVRTIWAFGKNTTTQALSPIGFCQYDPIYEHGIVIGYLASVSRGDPDFGQGLSYALNAHAMEVFRSEGIGFLDLGLCPFYLDGDTVDKDYPSSPWIQAFLRFIYRRYSGVVYGFEGLRFAKTRYGGTDEMHWIATPTALPGIGAFRALGDVMTNHHRPG